MKFNPYAALLMTGALMVITVVIAQIGANSVLLKEGAASVDRDVSSFAAKTLTSFQRQQALTDAERDPQTRVASIDKQAEGRQSDN
jgi:hypothetical protein